MEMPFVLGSLSLLTFSIESLQSLPAVEAERLEAPYIDRAEKCLNKKKFFFFWGGGGGHKFATHKFLTFNKNGNLS